MKMNTSKEYIINEYLSLKLENRKTIIYVNGERYRQCIRLLLAIPKREFFNQEGVGSIDEATQRYRDTHNGKRYTENGSYYIAPEQEFWGHCSNLQTWYEHDYDTRLIHSNLAFSLLRRLIKAGDPLAKRVFKEEITKRLLEGNRTNFGLGNYLSYFSKEEQKFVYERIHQKIMEGEFEYLYFFISKRYSYRKDVNKKAHIKEFYFHILKGDVAVINFLLEDWKWDWFSLERILKCFSDLKELTLDIDKIIQAYEQRWEDRLYTILYILSTPSLKESPCYSDYRKKIVDKYFIPIIKEGEYRKFAILLSKYCFGKLTKDEIERIFAKECKIDIQKVLSYEDAYDLFDPLVDLLSHPILRKYELIKKYKNVLVREIINNESYSYQEDIACKSKVISKYGDDYLKKLLAQEAIKIFREDEDKHSFFLKFLFYDSLNIFNKGQLESIDIKELSFYGEFGEVNGDLPKEFGYLTSLEVIEFDEEYEIFSFPESIGNLKHLKILDLKLLPTLQFLPETILDIPNLQKVTLPNYLADFTGFKYLFRHESIKEIILEVWTDYSRLIFNLVEYREKLSLSEEELVKLAESMANLIEGHYGRDYEFPFDFIDILFRKYVNIADEKMRIVFEEFILKHLKIFHTIFGEYVENYAIEYDGEMKIILRRYGTSLSPFYLDIIREEFEKYIPKEYKSFFNSKLYLTLNENDLLEILKDSKLNLITQLDNWIENIFPYNFWGDHLEYRELYDDYRKTHSKWKRLLENDKLSEFQSYL